MHSRKISLEDEVFGRRRISIAPVLKSAQKILFFVFNGLHRFIVNEGHQFGAIR